MEQKNLLYFTRLYCKSAKTIASAVCVVDVSEMDAGLEILNDDVLSILFLFDSVTSNTSSMQSESSDCALFIPSSKGFRGSIFFVSK